jgi:predicted permease
VALSLALLASAGMLLRSFEKLMHTETGFDRQQVILFKIASESAGYRQNSRLSDLYGRVDAAVSAVPGVVSAAVLYESFAEGRWGEFIEAPGVNLPRNQRLAVLNFVTPGYFRTLGIPVLSGRTMDARDNVGAPNVAVVSETFAKRIFGGDAIGKTLMMSPTSEKRIPYRIIGIVRDVKTSDVRDQAQGLVWLPLAQGPVFSDTVAVRFRGDAADLTQRVREAIRATEPNLPIRYVTTLAEEVSDSLVTERALAELAALFAALALLLSAIGLYGTISFAVSRRTSEIGLRMALGAERTEVLGMVLREAMRLVGVGIAVGLPLAMGAAWGMQAITYGLGSFDALSAGCAVAVLGMVAAIAGYIPARRAARVDPMIALRSE